MLREEADVQPALPHGLEGGQEQQQSELEQLCGSTRVSLRSDVAQPARSGNLRERTCRED